MWSPALPGTDDERGEKRLNTLLYIFHFVYQVYAWGSSQLGQVGLGSRKGSSEPVMIADAFGGDEVAQVACGMYHSLVVTKSCRYIMCWLFCCA
jgi:hypothetical protein